MDIKFNELIKNIKDKKIIGIGESTHGTKQMFQIRIKIINSLQNLINIKQSKYKNIIVVLEEESNIVAKNKWMDGFTMYHSNIFHDKFLPFCKSNNIKLFGCDDSLDNNKRYKTMANNILNISNNNLKSQIIFLAFNSHISKLSGKDKKESNRLGLGDWKIDEPGKILYNKVKNNYVCIGLIQQHGKTLGKKEGEYLWSVIPMENTKEINELKPNTFYKNILDTYRKKNLNANIKNKLSIRTSNKLISEKNKNKTLKKSSTNIKNLSKKIELFYNIAGPIHESNIYNTKHLDYFYILDKGSEIKINKKFKLLYQ
jgi:hypothetical protein